MSKKTHDLVVDKNLLAQIDYILPKLKYSVNFRKIIRWLENFDSMDVRAAIDFLFFLEFIDTAELTFRIDEQLQDIFKKISDASNIFVYPGITEYPKSAEVINYIIKQTPSYEKRKKQGHCLITRDIEKDLIDGIDTAIIFVDDFIGSGKSFIKGYSIKTSLKTFLDSKPFVTQRFLMAAICMADGKAKIFRKHPEITIHAEIRNKLFHIDTSPFNLGGKMVEMKTIARKYGISINPINHPPFSAPFGFDGSESLIAFSHTTPNNTLPIIWSGVKWFPIYPRKGLDKINQSKDLKKEVAFYMGIMNRLGLDLYSDESIFVHNKRVIKYNSKEDHQLLCILKLKFEKYDLPSICQLLGITTGEYIGIIKTGQSKKLLDHQGSLSPAGLDFYTRLMKKAKNKRFIKKDRADFELKNIIYVPESFSGKK